MFLPSGNVLLYVLPRLSLWMQTAVIGLALVVILGGTASIPFLPHEMRPGDMSLVLGALVAFCIILSPLILTLAEALRIDGRHIGSYRVEVTPQGVDFRHDEECTHVPAAAIHAVLPDRSLRGPFGWIRRPRGVFLALQPRDSVIAQRSAIRRDLARNRPPGYSLNSKACKAVVFLPMPMLSGSDLDDFARKAEKILKQKIKTSGGQA